MTAVVESYIEIDENRVAWIADTRIKVIEIAVDNKGTLFWDGEAVAEATLNERLMAAGKAVTDPARDEPSRLPECCYQDYIFKKFHGQ